MASARPLLAWVLLALCALSFVACDSASRQASGLFSPSEVNAAVERTLTATSFRAEITLVEEPGGAEVGRTVIESDLEALYVSSRAEAPPYLVIETIQLGEKMYLRFPSPAGDDTEDKWGLIDYTDLFPGLDRQYLYELAQVTNPTVILHTIRDAIIESEKLDEETVRGVRADHIEVTVDVRKAFDAIPYPPGMEDEFEESIEEEIARLGSTTVIELWIDDEGRVVRARWTEAGDDPGTTRVTTEEYFDFGAPIETWTPDPADVASSWDGEGP